MVDSHRGWLRPYLSFAPYPPFCSIWDDCMDTVEKYISGEEYGNHAECNILEDPENEGDDEGPKKDIVGEVREGDSYMEIRGRNHRANWIPMGSDPPSGLPPAENIKVYNGGPVVGEEGAVTSILENFDLFYPDMLLSSS